MDDLIRAILNDNAAQARKLLKQIPALARQLAPKARLFESPILHWIYANDTALHLAAAGHRSEIVKLLIAAGADPNSSQNHRRSAPLHYAADGAPGNVHFNPNRQVETLELLLKAGADINAQDKNGATPLHRAVRTRCRAAVELLLEKGADPLIKNKPGSTPFHLAVQNTGRGGSGSEDAILAQKEIIQIFLRHGLKPNLKTTQGKTVLSQARSPWIQQALVRA